MNLRENIDEMTKQDVTTRTRTMTQKMKPYSVLILVIVKEDNHKAKNNE